MRFLLLLLFLAPSVANAQIFRFRRAVPVQQQGIQYNCANGQCIRVTPSAISSDRYSPSELKSIVASSPSVPHVRVNGSTYQHLQDSRHGFTAAQLSGLSQAELSRLHDLEHYGLVKPFKAKSVTTPRGPLRDTAKPTAPARQALKHPTSINI